MAVTDAAVLTAVEQALLHPEVVERALDYALAAIASDRSAEKRASPEADLGDTEQAIRRLTAATVSGRSLESLVDALATSEGLREDLRARLDAIVEQPPAEDPVSVRQQLRAFLGDWRGRLPGHVGVSRSLPKTA
jgi:hypothetical protein